MTAPGLSLTIDCRDPRVMVEFWCAALGYVPEPPPHGHPTWYSYWRDLGIPEEELIGAEDAADSIIDPHGRRPRIWFQIVPEPKSVKNRVHIDIDVSDGRRADIARRRGRVNAEAERLKTLGAVVVRSLAPAGADYYAVVMADPEGNEFCLS